VSNHNEMQRWIVYDRGNREIYLTEERWEHIVSKHNELADHFNELLDTIRYGRRRQERRDPQRYRYREVCYTLPDDNNHITAVVVFSFHTLTDGTMVENNFVATAWGEDLPI